MFFSVGVSRIAVRGALLCLRGLPSFNREKYDVLQQEFGVRLFSSSSNKTRGGQKIHSTCIVQSFMRSAPSVMVSYF